MNTAQRTNIMPKSPLKVSFSLKKTTLKTVADIGSRMPMADAVPAGM